MPDAIHPDKVPCPETTKISIILNYPRTAATVVVDIEIISVGMYNAAHIMAALLAIRRVIQKTQVCTLSSFYLMARQNRRCLMMTNV